MYVCICKAVSEATIARAVDSGVQSMRELARQTGCSSQCGRCATHARQALADALAQRQPLLQLMVAAPGAA